MTKDFSPQDVAQICGLTERTIIKKIHKKKLKARRVRSYAIDGEEVKRFLLEQANEKRLND
jgi:Helix-turn-helix domain